MSQPPPDQQYQPQPGQPQAFHAPTQVPGQSPMFVVPQQMPANGAHVVAPRGSSGMDAIEAVSGITLGLLFSLLASVVYLVMVALITFLMSLFMVGTSTWFGQWLSGLGAWPAYVGIVVVAFMQYLVGRAVSSYAIAPQPNSAGYLGIVVGVLAGIMSPIAVISFATWWLTENSGVVDERVQLLVGLAVTYAGTTLVAGIVPLVLGALHTGLKAAHQLGLQRRAAG